MNQSVVSSVSHVMPPATETRKIRKLKRLIAKRAELQTKVSAIDKAYQPRLDKLIAAREKKTQGARTRILQMNQLIKVGILELSGTEIGQLRRTYPLLKELP